MVDLLLKMNGVSLSAKIEKPASRVQALSYLAHAFAASSCANCNGKQWPEQAKRFTRKKLRTESEPEMLGWFFRIHFLEACPMRQSFQR